MSVAFAFPRLEPCVAHIEHKEITVQVCCGKVLGYSLFAMGPEQVRHRRSCDDQAMTRTLRASVYVHYDANNDAAYVTMKITADVH